MFENRIRLAKALFNTDTSISHVIRPGEGKIMFSAPHSALQTRNGIIKNAEPQTGMLAELLHQDINCPVIYKKANCNDDANFDLKSVYRDDLEKYIKKNGIMMVIDLHQLSPKRDIMIDIGTGKGKNLSDINILNFILKAFSEKNVGIIQIDCLFCATHPSTVSAAMHQKCNIPCVQIEMNSRLLYPKYQEYCFEAIYYALKNLHNYLAEYFSYNKRMECKEN